MKLKFKKLFLVKGLNIGCSYASNRNLVLPILECVKMQVVDNICWIMSYDQRNAISVKIPVEESEKNITFCVNASNFKSYVSLLDEEDVNITINETYEDTNGYKTFRWTMDVSAGNSSCSFPLEDSEYYPVIQKETNTQDITIEASTMLYWLKSSRFFIEKNELKPTFQCAHMIVSGNEINVYATDGYKMYRYKLETESNYDGRIQLSFDLSAFPGIEQTLKSMGDSLITIKNGESNIKMVCDNIMLLVRKHEFMKLPNFDTMFSYPVKCQVQIKKVSLMSIIDRASLISNVAIAVITIEVLNDKLLFRSESFDTGKTSNDIIEFFTGCNLAKQAYNINHFKAAIAAMSSDMIQLSFCDEKTVLLIENMEDEREKAVVCQYIVY